MKKLIVALTALMMAFAAEAKNDELGIAYDQIPEKAQNFIAQYFDGVQVKRAAQKFDDGIAEYVVYLKNKVVLEFDMIGAWSEVEGAKKVAIPTEYLPAKVKNTLSTKFEGKKVRKVENDGFDYEISFTDGSEAEINANGVVTEVEAD